MHYICAIKNAGSSANVSNGALAHLARARHWQCRGDRFESDTLHPLLMNEVFLMKKVQTTSKAKVILLIFTLLFISLNSFPANTKFYNISDIYGITSGEAFSICKDKHGFIWASTKTGILRVTEGDCRNYELPCKTTDFVFVKLTYGNSQLFSYTNNSQIFHYDEVTDRFLFLADLREETGNNHITIGTITADKTGTLWIASSTGLFKYENNTLTRITQSEKEIKQLTFYKNNQLFYITSAGISLLEMPTLKSRLIYPYNAKDFFQIPSLYYDEQLDRLWIGTGAAGLFYYDITQKTLSAIPIKGFPKQPILTIKKDANNTLLIGIDGQGIWHISEKGDKLLNIYKEDLNNPFSLRGDGVYDILCDESRNWVATYTGKLSFFENGNSLIIPITYQINNPNSLGNNYVNKIIEDHKGYIWFATNNGLSRWNPISNKWNHYYRDKSEQAKVFLSLCEDSQGRIWAGSYSSGVYLLDGKTGQTLQHYSSKTHTPGFSGDFIFDCFVDAEGDVWIGGNQNLSCYRNKENSFREYPIQPVSAFAELAPGKLLLTTSHGLFLLDKNHGTIEALVEGSLAQDVVVTDNTVWIATCRDGLIKYDYDKRQTERFTTESGLTSNYVNSILLDNGFLWIGTESGLCRLNILNNTIRSYTSVYSLSNTTFCVNSCTRLKNGKLVWGTNNGAIMFTPKLLQETRPKGKIFFQNITVAGRSIRTIPHLLNNTPVNQQKKLSLNYTQNNFMLELLPTGGSARNMKFSWLLEGLDTNWSRPSELHFINYTNLPGGDFKLHIRMYDGSLSQIIDERSLNIHITPPFWKTWWFAILISLCIGGYIIYAFKSYSNRLKRKSTNDRLIADAAQVLMQEKMAQSQPTTREEKSVLQSKPNDPFVNKAIAVINENIANSEFGKEEFAAAMNVSPSLLYKKIKTLTDQSPSDFIKAVRMNHALKLLQSGQYTVTEVSELSGFSSLSIFSRAFKKHFGKTPTEI